MKNSKLFTAMAFAFMMLVSFNSNAQKFRDLDKSPLDIAYFKTSREAAPIAKVIYSRPQLKGRSLSKLAPNGKMWRTGANEATEVKFFNDVTFGGEKIKVGTYSLFTVPGESEWTVILSSDLDVWGAYSYKEANDVAKFKVKPTEGNKSIEAFSIAFTASDMVLAWDKLRVAIPISK